MKINRCLRQHGLAMQDWRLRHPQAFSYMGDRELLQRGLRIPCLEGLGHSLGPRRHWLCHDPPAPPDILVCPALAAMTARPSHRFIFMPSPKTFGLSCMVTLQPQHDLQSYV